MFTPDFLSGRVALVTGASSGLGRHFAQVLAQHGAEVVIAARAPTRSPSSPPSLRQPASRRIPSRSTCATRRAWRAPWPTPWRRRGASTFSSTTPAWPRPSRRFRPSDDEWRSVVDTNLDGAFRVARAVAKTMADAKTGGAIVNIASILGLRVTKQVPAYIAAKAGLLRLSEALALEWAVHGIRVNAIAPGYVETELNRDFLRSPAGEALGKRVAQRRFGKPEDLDGALLLLASDAGRYMTGATITVDGGLGLAWL